MKKYFLHFLILITRATTLLAQSPVNQTQLPVPESEIESSVVQSEQSEQDYTYFDAIENYAINPLSLNASKEQIEAFPFFSPNQIDALLRHRSGFGKFLCIEELQVLDEFDPEFIRQIKNLITVEPAATQKSITARGLLSESDNSVMLRYQKKLSNSDEMNAYPGSNEKILFRYKYQFADRIKFGITGEKDPGETLSFEKNRKGFDFYSGYLFLYSKSFIRQISIGDFGVQQGQGLVMWSGMGFGKSSEVLNIQKNAGGIRPHSSSEENNFLRGVCISSEFKNWNADVFYSNHLKDANLNNEGDEKTFTSFQSSGLHRTNSELENKSSLRETVAGILLNKKAGAFAYGGIATYTDYSAMMLKESKLYNKFEFKGKTNLNYAVNFRYLFKNISSFGEIARSTSGGMAIMAGAIIHLHPKLSYSVLWRKYSASYHAFYSMAFSENTKPANENGLYSSLQIGLPFKFTLSLYTDFFSNSWLKYLDDAPGNGYEYLVQLKWKPGRNFETYFLLKNSVKEKNSSNTAEIIHTPEPNSHSSLRWNLRTKLNESWDWGSRIEHSMFSKGDSKNHHGFLFFQDLIFHPPNSSFAGGIRYAFFDTDDFDTRIYAYENDVLYSYSIPALQGKGQRMYINAKYRISRGIEMWIRYSVSMFGDVLKLPEKEIKLQVRFRF